MEDILKEPFWGKACGKGPFPGIYLQHDALAFAAFNAEKWGDISEEIVLNKVYQILC